MRRAGRRPRRAGPARPGRPSSCVDRGARTGRPRAAPEAPRGRSSEACLRGRYRSIFGSMPDEKLIIRGAREHNLRNIDVEIPRDRLTVMTGLSGSGKSSLAFDTIYAEGQRRYVESLSAYARQFLG